jgi:hypothetical protein
MRMREWFVSRVARALLSACVLIACNSGPKAENALESAPKPQVQTAQAAGSPLPAAQPPAAAPAPAPAATPAPSNVPADVEKALAYDPKDPLGDLESADALDRMANGGPEKGAKHDAKAPPGGCAVIDEGRRVWPAPGPATIAAVGRAFVVAGYAQRNGKEQLFVVRAPNEGLPEPIAAINVQPQLTRARTAAPGLAVRDENDIDVAQVDGAGKLTVRRLRLGHAGHGAIVELATGVDIRFAPAVESYQERTLVAWTMGSTPMHTQLAVLSDDQIESRHDLTPSSMGAAAPVFVAGASPPVLMAVDARDGMSPILRVDFGNDAQPQQAQVAVPVSMVSSPPALAAAAGSVGTYVAFTGLGSAASSAVGLVTVAPIVGSPSTLIPGTAYGQLYVAATSAPRALIFAADAPTQPGKDPPHEIRVSVVGIKGPGPTMVLKGPGSSASHVGLARNEAGEVGVVFSAESGVYVARLRCDDGG